MKNGNKIKPGRLKPGIGGGVYVEPISNHQNNFVIQAYWDNAAAAAAKRKKKKKKTNSGQMKTKSENLFRIQQRFIILSLSE